MLFFDSSFEVPIKRTSFKIVFSWMVDISVYTYDFKVMYFTLKIYFFVSLLLLLIARCIFFKETFEIAFKKKLIWKNYWQLIGEWTPKNSSWDINHFVFSFWVLSVFVEGMDSKFLTNRDNFFYRMNHYYLPLIFIQLIEIKII